jgi:hypothetical protein
MRIGIALDLAFLMSLFWLVKPVNWRELIVFALPCTSTMVFFALERGNVDVIIFVILVAAGVLSTGQLASRLLSYALILLAGLLKFYPVTVLSTALRERPRTFFAISAAAGLIISGFVYRFHGELRVMARNIPHGLYDLYVSDRFGAVNLPFGLEQGLMKFVPGLGQFAWFRGLPFAIMAILVVAIAAQVIRLFHNAGLASAYMMRCRSRTRCSC